MGFFSKLKRVGNIAAKGVQVVQDARSGNITGAVGGALEVVNAIQSVSKQTGNVAISNGAAHEDSVKAVAVGLDDHESRLAQLEKMIAELTQGGN